MVIAATKYSSKRHQPDLVTAQYSFADRCFVGPAIITVEDIKKGRNMSNLQVTVWQDAHLDAAPWIDRAHSRRALLATMVFADLGKLDAALSLPTAYQSHADLAGTACPDPDFARLIQEDGDDHWMRSVPPPAEQRSGQYLPNKALYVPRTGVFTPGVLDMWARLATGERWTQHALPYAADFLPHELDRYLFHPDLKAMADEVRNSDKPKGGKSGKSSGNQAFWLATLAMNLETKDLLPLEGVEWLHVRMYSKHLAGGKFDQDVEVRDESGNLIMLAHSVFMALQFERTTKTKEKL